MRKVRKQTKKIEGELLSLRDSRKSIDEFNFTFLTNFSDNSRLMHTFVGEDKNELFDVAFRQYLVFLVSCWETFFRDLFVYVNTRDSDSIGKLIDEMKVNEDILDLSKITLPELLSKSFNFQNINDLESAYNSLWGANFLESVCETTTKTCGINGKVAHGFSVNSLFANWHSTITKVFNIRHKVVHDASYRPEIDIPFMQQAEALFLLIPQLATYFMAEKFSLKRVVLSNDEFSVPYVFNMNDVISDDWEIIE